MKTLQPTRMAVLGMAILLCVGTFGCATKRYVRRIVDPVGARTAELEKKTAGHDTQIEGLDRQVSAANERAKSADSRAQDAAAGAAAAQQTANSAGSQATDAQNLAHKGLAATDAVDRKLSTRIEELDNYRLITTESVLFGLNRSELTEDAKSRLGVGLQKLGSVKHFVIQVEGFTDKTGGASYNLELSRRRADAVVRYLATTGKVPLYRIHVVGLGSANPIADNSTRKGRVENRRVEVKLFAADTGLSGVETAGHIVENQ